MSWLPFYLPSRHHAPTPRSLNLYPLPHLLMHPPRDRSSLRPRHLPAEAILGALALIGLAFPLHAASARTQLSLVGDWSVQVEARRAGLAAQAPIQVPPASWVEMTRERYDSLPVFNPRTAGWVKGTQLKGLQAQETTTPFLLDPTLVVVTPIATDANNSPFERGQDYEIDPDWGTVGRLAQGRITEGTPVDISYRYAPLRIDSIVQTRFGTLQLRPGHPRSAAPEPPTLASRERRIANIWIPGRISRLEPKHLFPITETEYQGETVPKSRTARYTLPKTYQKLRAGQSVRVLAWGDSVTDGSYLPDPAKDRWQAQFIRRLQAAFPRARIELITEAWGGRNTSSYLAEPPGSPHNYQEKVLAAKPDLVVSEFVNDAGLNPVQVEERYGKLLRDFLSIGAEWIILTPHYVRPDWMGLDRENNIDNDPRPYVAGLRQFAEKNPVALADASRRYGRLWRQGIPYTSLMLNSINHPNARGMSIFADALMELFP
jgi:lysophospholipase L1-like esterase